jgi:TPP-dependent 2-oxoacid decarboxylase
MSLLMFYMPYEFKYFFSGLYPEVRIGKRTYSAHEYPRQQVIDMLVDNPDLMTTQWNRLHILEWLREMRTKIDSMEGDTSQEGYDLSESFREYARSQKPLEMAPTWRESQKLVSTQPRSY